ncbi:MAG: BlaI/MecI/CopY family transcriptional regulator [Candidatus Izemoplasmatales bacterium]|jgi:predicted transcriptional regulator|nr:BlaI/MecI/CopY family transcriptional regulator [Candidatus Izemoplasmatales bacterium]
MDNQYSITNSEWVIMRILLNKSPLGSKEIINQVQDQNNWSVATIKTFLSRLVSKNVIGYRKIKNAFIYFPTVTEMVYIRNEMRAFYSRLYGDVIHYETAHFQFSGQNDLEYAHHLGDMLEKYYLRVSRDLEIELTRKQIIYIYPTIKGLHSALGYEEGPSWLTAGWFWEIVHIAPKDSFTNIKPELIASHVFTQLLIHYINPRAPFWLWQGVSVYESGWLTFDKIKAAISILRKQIHPHLIFRISTDDDLFKNQYGYELTYTVIEFIVNRFGNSSLLQFIKAPEQMRFIFNMSEDEFWKVWIEFIQTRYINEE